MEQTNTSTMWVLPFPTDKTTNALFFSGRVHLSISGMFYPFFTPRRWLNAHPQLIPGHESIGSIVKMGKNVKGFAIGDRCVADVGITVSA